VKIAIPLLAYAYWPLLYFGIYLPLIVPRLNQWEHIPYWLIIGSIMGFIVVVAKLGSRSIQRAIIFHAIGISIFVELFLFFMVYLGMPGFRNPNETSLLGSILSIVIMAICLVTLAEAGYFLVQKKATRTEN
jgi:hypothetical protein